MNPELWQNLEKCWNLSDDVIREVEVVCVGHAPRPRVLTHWATDSLVSRHTADILIGPELPGGTGRWLLWGWTSERADRQQWVPKHWLAIFGPPEEHLTACDCICSAFFSWESRSNHRHADITSPVLFAETAQRSLFIQRRRKYWTLKLFSSMLMKRRCNNIYTARTFQHTSAGWMTVF